MQKSLFILVSAAGSMRAVLVGMQGYCRAKLLGFWQICHLLNCLHKYQKVPMTEEMKVCKGNNIKKYLHLRSFFTFWIVLENDAYIWDSIMHMALWAFYPTGSSHLDRSSRLERKNMAQAFIVLLTFLLHALTAESPQYCIGYGQTSTGPYIGRRAVLETQVAQPGGTAGLGQVSSPWAAFFLFLSSPQSPGWILELSELFQICLVAAWWHTRGC